MLATGGGIPRGQIGVVLAAGLAGGAIFLLILIRRPIRHTTLRHAWGWAAAALASLGIVEVWFQLQPAGNMSIWLPAVRYLAGALSLCPIIAVLGAKRPQERAWNFIVLALWGVVSLPAVLSLAIGRGEEFHLSDLRGVILWVAIALPAINYIATSFAAAALLVVIGQVILFAPHLPLIGAPLLATDPGLGCLACFWAAALVALRSQPSTSGEELHSFNLLWRTFRDQFGLFWGLRVQERVNAAAQQHQWPYYLSWTGFRGIKDDLLVAEIPHDHRKTLTQTFRQLLRRFATPKWIATWLPEGID